MCSFVGDFIALEIMASELVALHDDNFCEFYVSYACAVEPRRRFVTEHRKKKKKKESLNLNPGYSAWVTSKATLYMYMTKANKAKLTIVRNSFVSLPA